MFADLILGFSLHHIVLTFRISARNCSSVAHIFVCIVIFYLTTINFAHSLLLLLKLSGILCYIYCLVEQHCTYALYTIMLRHLMTWFRVITISAFFIFSVESKLRKF